MVGPVFFLLIETSLTKGVRKAIVFDLGVLAADMIFIVLIAYGSRQINIFDNAVLVYTIGGFLIIAYGFYNVFSARKKKRHLENDDELPTNTASDFVYIVKGFFLNFLNMGVFAYWLTTTVTLRATLEGNPDEEKLILTYFIATVAAYFLTDLTKIFTAQKIKKALTPEFLVNLERVVGIILVVFGVILIVRGYLTSHGIGF
jgi:threonine/homoserine/homoserine lactone efflux protein